MMTVLAQGDRSLSDKKVPRTEKLARRLTKEQYRVTQECGTEPPFTGKYYAHKDGGKYLCVCCGNRFVSSAEKYDSGTGWAPFLAPPRQQGRGTALQLMTH